MNTDTDSDIDIRQNGALHVVTFTRPQALNALTTDMRAKVSALLPKVARDPMSYAIAIRSGGGRAFCAGGDVRQIVALSQQDQALGRKAVAEEFYLSWQHECFSKPTISLIDGLVMGSGVGITAYGTHRVAGEDYRFAMPETAIGLFPDVGVSYLFSQMPDHIGLYLGLTGRRIKRAAAYELGLVTHCIDQSAFDAIVEEVADVQPVDPVLDSRHQDPGPSELDPVRDTIRHCFSADSVEAILSRLEAVSGPNKDWAREVVNDLNAKAPLSLKVTFQHIQSTGDVGLRQTLMTDYTLVSRFMLSHDFPEGVRAALIDKDKSPRWQPAHLSDVSPDLVKEMFQPVPDNAYVLPTRDEMQAARS